MTDSGDIGVWRSRSELHLLHVSAPTWTQTLHLVAQQIEERDLEEAVIDLLVVFDDQPVVSILTERLPGVQ